MAAPRRAGPTLQVVLTAHGAVQDERRAKQELEHEVQAKAQEASGCIVDDQMIAHLSSYASDRTRVCRRTHRCTRSRSRWTASSPRSRLASPSRSTRCLPCYIVAAPMGLR